MDLNNLIHQPGTTSDNNNKAPSSITSSTTFTNPTAPDHHTHPTHAHGHPHAHHHHGHPTAPANIAPCKLNDPATVTLAYVRKLDGLYKNLEERVRHLESALCTGSVLVLPPGAEASSGNAESIGVALSTTNNANANAIPTLATTAANSANKKISKTDLEDYCLPLLQKRASPTLGELSTLAMTMKTAKYHQLESRLILSKIREWFRRKREYMTQRVVNVCQRRFPPASLNAEAVSSLLLAFSRNSVESVALLREVAKEANLEVVEEESLLEFAREKCVGYLENLQMTLKQI